MDEAEIDDAMAAMAAGAADLEGWKVAGANGAVPLGEMEIGEDVAPPKLTVRLREGEGEGPAVPCWLLLHREREREKRERERERERERGERERETERDRDRDRDRQTEVRELARDL